MTTEPQLPTTSATLADRLLGLLGDAGFKKVEVLHPSAGMTELGAHSALIIVTEDNERFGLEVNPFPRLPRALRGPATVRGVDGSRDGA